jgi:hypothetical protein
VRTVLHTVAHEVSLPAEQAPSQVPIEQSWFVSLSENQSSSEAYTTIDDFICMLKADNEHTVNQLSECVQ